MKTYRIVQKNKRDCHNGKPYTCFIIEEKGLLWGWNEFSPYHMDILHFTEFKNAQDYLSNLKKPLPDDTVVQYSIRVVGPNK